MSGRVGSHHAGGGLRTPEAYLVRGDPNLKRLDALAGPGRDVLLPKGTELVREALHRGVLAGRRATLPRERPGMRMATHSVLTSCQPAHPATPLRARCRAGPPSPSSPCPPRRWRLQPVRVHRGPEPWLVPC